MGRLSNSWSLLKSSFRVVKQDKELMVLPIMSFLATIIALVAIVGLAYPYWPEFYDAETGDISPLAMALTFILYLALAYINVYFQAALITGANERLGGGDPTLGSALRGASSHAGKLFLYAIMVAVVNVILQLIRSMDKNGNMGRFIAGIAGSAWNLATWLMVPVLLFEDKGVGESLKRSGSLFKKTWGETLVAEFGMGLLFFLLALPILLVAGLLTVGLGSVLGAAGFVIGIAVGILGLITLALVQSVVTGAYKAALYRYVTKGETAEGYDPMMFQNAFHSR